MKLSVDVDGIRGFLDPVEGEALYHWAIRGAALGPCLEIGSYCGKSTLYLGQACQDTGQILFAVDHHRGSEEHQPGEEYHDTELFDVENQIMDSFPEFRRTLRKAGLEETVVPVVAASKVAAKAWATPLGLVFIDGGHSLEAALIDLDCWSSQVMEGGYLLIHDIFPDPAEGGQAPYIIWNKARESGLFRELTKVKTLGVLQRVKV